MTKIPSPTTDKKAKAAMVQRAAPTQTIMKSREKMNAINIYVFMLDSLVSTLCGGGGGGF